MKIEDQTYKSKTRKYIEKFPFLHDFIYSKVKNLRAKKMDIEARSIINKIYNKKACDLFSHVQIETISKCNGKCSFCPVNTYTDPRNLEFMDEEVFFKVIYELKKISYKGVVSFFGNNEALLDKRIVDWIERSREILPQAVFSLYTNGTPLNLSKFIRLTDILDEFIINNYSDNSKLHSNIEEIIKYQETSNKNYKNVTIRKRLENQIMHTRAGNSPVALNQVKVAATCTYPFHQINILPSGNISLCCNDAYGEQIMGNIKNNSLVKIWNDQNYKDLREKIYSTRQNIKICKSCDEIQNHDDYIHKSKLIDKSI